MGSQPELAAGVYRLPDPSGLTLVLNPRLYLIELDEPRGYAMQFRTEKPFAVGSNPQQPRDYRILADLKDVRGIRYRAVPCKSLGDLKELLLQVYAAERGPAPDIASVAADFALIALLAVSLLAIPDKVAERFTTGYALWVGAYCSAFAMLEQHSVMNEGFKENPSRYSGILPLNRVRLI
jgi:hypothetical protein